MCCAGLQLMYFIFLNKLEKKIIFELIFLNPLNKINLLNGVQC